MADRKEQPARTQGRSGGPQAGQGGRAAQGGQGGGRGQGGQGGQSGRAAQGGQGRREDRRDRQPDLPPPPTGPRPTPRLRERYDREVRGALIQEFSYQNVMQAPKVEKVVINIGMGEAITNSGAMDAAVRDLQTISGQQPVVTRAKRSIAAFKLRTGQSIGCMVTLRGARMYDFLDKLFNISLPRIKDFKGVSTRSLDGRGGMNIGIREQLIFPEIEYDKIDKIRGMDISIVTTARTDEEARELLRTLGMPIREGA